MRTVIFGAGMQGRVIAANLASRADAGDVVLADATPPTDAPRSVEVARVDALDADAVAAAADGASCAVLALPGGVAHAALANLVRARVPVVDVSFTPESPFVLDEAARAAGVPVVVDCGVAPGLSHVLAAACHRELGGLDSLRILVGGLPLAPPPVFRHAIFFNARDLLDEYIRPARLRVGGRDEAPPPLDAPVDSLVDEEVGALDGFPSDGLRSLLGSFPDVPDMVEVTLRLPGHLDTMRDLRALGLLEGDTATDAVAAALAERFPTHAFPDRLLMEVWGERGGRSAHYRLHATQNAQGSAMSRTTGFTTAAVAALVARGGFTVPGVHAPERLGADASATQAILDDLAVHGLVVTRERRIGTRAPGSAPPG